MMLTDRRRAPDRRHPAPILFSFWARLRPMAGASQKVEALLAAADAGDVAEVETMLGSGADANLARAVDGLTPLMQAASSGHTACVQLLLDRGADSAAADEDGDTALSHARINGRREVEELLRRRGATIVLQI